MTRDEFTLDQRIGRVGAPAFEALTFVYLDGGILGRRGTDDAVMDEHGIGRIDLVVVNLYPFQQTIANPEATLADAIENIDIGGPTMIRAAAKNHGDVAVVVDPKD